MQKRLFSVLMAIVMLFSIFPTFVFAETGDTFTVEAMHEYMPNPVPVSYKVLTEDASGGTVAVAGQGSNPAIPTDTISLTLPDTVTNNGKTYTVTEIGDGAFSGCTSLMYIGLPSSLTKIGNGAFYGCSNLPEIIIDSQYPPEIGDNVFKGCATDLCIYIHTGTKEDYIAAGWPEKFLCEGSYIEGLVFDTYYCTIEGEGVTVSLYDEEGKLLDSYTTGSDGYYEFNNLKEDVTYTIEIKQDGYITRIINYYAVLGCNSVLIPLANSSNGFSANTAEGESITYEILTKDDSSKTGTVRIVYGSEPLYNGLITLPNTVIHDGITYTVTEIGACAFMALKNMMLDALPSGITNIGNMAFWGCKNINLTSLPNGLEEIQYYAFVFCTGLSFIDIPTSVTDIGDSAFMGCSNLSGVVSGSKTPAQLGNDVFANCAPYFEINIPNGTREAYIAKGWPEANLVEFSLFTGEILDTYSNPIEGATVSVYDENGNFKGSVITDENGYFDATDNLEYGVEYTAKIEKPGYMTMSRNFVADYSSVLGPYYSIPLATFDGGFSSDTVEKAPITYQILTKDETSKTGTVRIVGGPGSLYSGTITLPNTVTYDGITYTVTEIGDYAFYRHHNTTFVALPSGLETVDLRDFNLSLGIGIISNNQIPPKCVIEHGLAIVQPTVYIPAGTKQAYIDAGWKMGNYPLNLKEVAFSSLSGKVVDENGKGIADAKVTISNDSGYQESVYTDSEGRYSFNNYFLNSEFVNSYVANGCNKIRIEKAGYSEYVVDLKLFEGDITNIGVTLSPAPVTPAPPNNPAIPTNNPNEANTTQTSINNTPQTGDNAQYVIYIVFGCMLMVILAAGCLVVAKKKS